MNDINQAQYEYTSQSDNFANQLNDAQKQYDYYLSRRQTLGQPATGQPGVYQMGTQNSGSTQDLNRIGENEALIQQYANLVNQIRQQQQDLVSKYNPSRTLRLN